MDQSVLPGDCQGGGQDRQGVHRLSAAPHNYLVPLLPGRDGSGTEWRPLIGPDQKIYCALIGWEHFLAPLALLCHKDTAQGSQSLGTFLSLCLHGWCEPSVLKTRRF